MASSTGDLQALMRGTRDLSLRFRGLLLHWLSSLPRTGWSGGVRDLADALQEHAVANGVHHGVFIPAGAGLTRTVLAADPELAAAGWQISQTRTAAARTIAFVRAAPAGRR